MDCIAGNPWQRLSNMISIWYLDPTLLFHVKVQFLLQCSRWCCRIVGSVQITLTETPRYTSHSLCDVHLSSQWFGDLPGFSSWMNVCMWKALAKEQWPCRQTHTKKSTYVMFWNLKPGRLIFSLKNSFKSLLAQFGHFPGGLPGFRFNTVHIEPCARFAWHRQSPR